MKLTLDKKHANRVVFVAKDSVSTFANMVRRYGMSRISVMAIDAVTFYDNTSAFWDEYLSHRLGLLPLLTPENTPKTTEVTFSLDAEGPKVVYASDLVSSDKEITVAKGAIPVVTLGPNQHLRFECKAISGTARTHAKYQAGLIGYGVEDDTIKYVVETFFQMEPSEVVLRTCDLILDDIEKVEAALGKKPEKKEKPAKKAKKKKEE
ncbi:DNA-directed RNA polymerase subunit D [Candidatus Bilamarchaeum dharawalense]|uniref:DNA-directed RNA polymerase subunit D n=1 Tax=Candidatus Bilamarchaeum dharawalense TaxID=2885759 RepID=A0A5E4LQ40_9ARCH|nr:DNA-directed RNA polymerase subunit D [Candidatus Bilamarchaeum dharawalense]